MNEEQLATLDISDELKARAMAATSPAELLALASEAGIELTDEQLEGIAGGREWYEDPERSDAEDPGDTRDDIDEALVSEAFRTGADLGDDVE